MGKVRVRCIHGDETKHKTTNVTVEIKGQKYLLTVGVMDTCPYPIILGQDVPVMFDRLQRDANPANCCCVIMRAQFKKSDQEIWSELPLKTDRKQKSLKQRGVKLKSGVRQCRRTCWE